jgi:hypothetical protein
MLKTPVPLGPFIVEESGQLSLRRPDGKLAFWFIWRGRRVDAWLSPAGVSLGMQIGRTPSTARGTMPREPAFALLRALPATLPPGWSMRLTAEHTIRIQAVEAMAWPTTVAALIEPLVRFLLSVSPYLDVAEGNGFGITS